MTLTRPNLPLLEGLGSAATKNTGIAAGEIPVIGVATASDTLAGLVELATLAETITGTDPGRVVTPVNLAGAFVRNAQANGSLKIPGGFTIQWGVTGGINSGAVATVTFTLQFAVACRQVLVGIRDNSAVTTAATGQWGSGAYTTSQFSIYNRTNQTYVFNWIAIGD